MASVRADKLFCEHWGPQALGQHADSISYERHFKKHHICRGLALFGPSRERRLLCPAESYSRNGKHGTELINGVPEPSLPQKALETGIGTQPAEDIA